MSIILEASIPPPHLLQNKTVAYPSAYHTHRYPAPASSPAPMSPQSLHSYMSHLSESPLPSQELTSLPTSGWFGPSLSAPECHSETSYAPYGHFIPSQSAPLNLSPPASAFSYSGKAPVSTTHVDPSAAISPDTVYSRDSALPESTRPSEEPQSTDARSAAQHATSRLTRQPHLMDRPHSSSDSMHSGAVDVPWTMSPLGIHSNQESYYQAFPTMTHSPRLSEPSIEVSSNQMASPQPRRMYTPIAPMLLGTPRSHGSKRFREEEEEPVVEDSKRRKRSDSQMSTQFELSEEDKLLLQLKEEESMPWKDIAARFQTDLNKNYQIPALQMRFKRLRERMRVWSEQDVKALRDAHEYWAQNKFEIISAKMAEFGALEKWTARQCSRKWQELDPAAIPYAHFEPHIQHGFATYAMSPVEPSPSNSLFYHLHAQ